MENRVSVVFTIGVLLVAGIVGAVVIGEFGDQLDERNEELHHRAEAVYGEDYRIVESEACWDYCATTATTRQQQKEDVLYTLKRNRGWISETRLEKSAPGRDLDDILNELAEADDVEHRSGDGWGETDQYRYTGDADMPERLSDDRVRQRVSQRLFLLGGSMTTEQIADDLPVTTTRVEIALQTLMDDGAVDDGYVSQGMVFFASHQYIDARHGTLPDSVIAQYQPITVPLGVILLAVVLIGIIQRYRTENGQDA